MKEIYTTERVPENCSTCLYGRGLGCGCADRQKDWLRYGLLGLGCPNYWLDQNRFPNVKGNRWSSYYTRR